MTEFDESEVINGSALLDSLEMSIRADVSLVKSLLQVGPQQCIHLTSITAKVEVQYDTLYYIFKCIFTHNFLFDNVSQLWSFFLSYCRNLYKLLNGPTLDILRVLAACVCIIV